MFKVGIYINFFLYICIRVRLHYVNISNMEGIIGGIIVGIIAGFLAGKIMRGQGFGCLWNCILGVVGGVVGGWLFNLLNISWGGLVGQIGTAVIGAALVLWIASLVKGK